MKITSTGIHNGKFNDIYGKRSTYLNENGVPTYSIPFRIEDAPENTVSFAIVLEDKDAIPVSGGFVWIHWIAANIMRYDIKDNESQSAYDFVQGLNSWTSMQGNQQSKELSRYYGGMCPPDKTHCYELHVYALDTVLPLENGFYMNEMFHAMRGHILEEGVLYGDYEA